MASLDLRPLSLGEILDRTFTLYRRHFLVFAGISGIPQLILLAFSLTRMFTAISGAGGASAVSLNLVLTLVLLAINVLAYLLSQGGTILAVSDLYLGRTASIGGALRKVASELGPLFGVIVLNGLVIVGGIVLLVIPGIYFACRLLIAVPVALIEDKSPRDSLSRSWDLTRDNAGRAFMILLFSVVIAYAAALFFALPFSIPMVLSRGPGMAQFWMAMVQVGSTVATTLTRPVLQIATSVFYYDLRVRKEAFDIQFLMDPESRRAPSASSLPSIL